MSDTPQPITTVNDQDGQRLSIAGGSYRIIISGKETGGSYAVIEMTVPPGGGPGPHAHPDMLESFYVVEGEVTFKSESGNYTARPGSFVNIPLGGIVHGFKNTSDSTARLICTVMPSGLEEFFVEVAGLAGTDAVTAARPPGTEEQQRLKSIAERYGQKVYPPDYLG